MRTGGYVFRYLIIPLLTSAIAMGQSHEKVLYSFGVNQNDGTIPNADLLFDGAGNIYGTTQRDGTIGAGTVFELSPQSDSTWTETILYHFCSLPNCEDGGVPEAGLISDSAGNLYGTTAVGGTFSGGTCHGAGCGTVFELSPPGNSGGSWTETVLWNFKGNLNNDGAQPFGRLAWDAVGNIYGTTQTGGVEASYGTVFELTPVSGGGWSEAVLYEFCASGSPCPNGALPLAGVSVDESGNLYGTAYGGGFHGLWGVVYELSPTSGGNWTESTLHEFMPQTGGNPLSEVSIDSQGNLYGTTSAGQYEGSGQCGSAWKLTRQSGFKASNFLFNQSGANGCAPASSLFLDLAANTAFGSTSKGGTSNSGTVFKITGSKETVLYNFCQQSGCFDGSTPSGSLTQHGRALYGATASGGTFNQGVVFEITP
jgi:hypothetical protein